MIYPNFNEEKKLRKLGFKNIVGLDEAGRGPLAGPVVAGAVLFLDFNFGKLGIRDSKKLSFQKREKLFKILTNSSAVGKKIKWGIGIVSEKVIDKINIKNASELAMEKAMQKLSPDFLLIDGNNIKNKKLKSIRHKLIVKGDMKVFSCAAASILAKVTRDRIMVKYSKKYPKYRFDLHKGYPTTLHLKLLKKHGICSIYRKSFGPVRNLIKKT